LNTFTGEIENFATTTKYRPLSQDIGRLSNMMNLKWTDKAASMLVGVKSRIGSPEASMAEIRLLRRQVTYNKLYGILGFICCAIWLVLAFISLGFLFTPTIRDRLMVRNIKQVLNRLSIGRSLVYLQDEVKSPTFNSTTKQWMKALGKTKINLSKGNDPDEIYGLTADDSKLSGTGLGPEKHHRHEKHESWIISGKEARFSVVERIPKSHITVVSPRAYGRRPPTSPDDFI
jgi:hypothetical protein